MTKPQLGGARQPGKMAGTAGQEPHGHLEHVAEAGGALGPSSPRAHRRASGGQLEGRGWCGEEHLLFKGRGQAKGLAPGRAGRGAGTGADGRAIRGVVIGRHGPPRRERGKTPAPTSSNLLRDQTHRPSHCWAPRATQLEDAVQEHETPGRPLPAARCHPARALGLEPGGPVRHGWEPKRGRRARSCPPKSPGSPRALRPGCALSLLPAAPAIHPQPVQALASPRGIPSQ